MEPKLAISISLWLLFIVVNASPTPTLQVKCIPETFFEDVAMTTYSCTICSTKRGRQFRQCKSVCRCTDIKSAVSQLSVSTNAVRIPTTMATTAEMPTAKATTPRMPPTMATKARTSNGTATQETVNLRTVSQQALVTLWSTNDLMVIIVVVSSPVVVVLLILAIFSFYRKNRQGHIQDALDVVPKHQYHAAKRNQALKSRRVKYSRRQ